MFKEHRHCGRPITVTVVQVQDGTGMEICSANCAGVELVDSTFMIKKGVL